MMKTKPIRALSALTVVSLVMLAGCSFFNREPRTDPEPVAPNQISDFDTLYAQNCAGCHGAQGRGGAAIALANPVYLAIADDATVRGAAANGIPGTSMPAFAQSAGACLLSCFGIIAVAFENPPPKLWDTNNSLLPLLAT